MPRLLVILSLLLLAITAGLSHAADTQGPGKTFETFTPSRIEPTPREFLDVDVDERMGARLPLELTVTDDAGQRVTLGSILNRGRPVILQLGYFGCPKLCGQVSEATVKSITDLDLLMGRDFDAIYLSFDPSERSELAREKKKHYLELYAGAKDLSPQQIATAANGWHFLTTDDPTAKKIAATVGFKYKWVESARQYSHPAVLIMITPDGTVSRYLYGAAFPPKTLRLSLVDASAGKVGGIMDKLIMFCFHFDPNTGTYTMQAMRLMRLGGFLTVMCLAALTGLMVLRGRQMRGVARVREKRGLAAVLAAGNDSTAPSVNSGTTER